MSSSIFQHHEDGEQWWLIKSGFSRPQRYILVSEDCTEDLQCGYVSENTALGLIQNNFPSGGPGLRRVRYGDHRKEIGTFSDLYLYFDGTHYYHPGTNDPCPDYMIKFPIDE